MDIFEKHACLEDAIVSVEGALEELAGVEEYGDFYAELAEIRDRMELVRKMVAADLRQEEAKEARYMDREYERMVL